MKERLQEISNGQAGLFVDLVEQYQDRVYTAAYQSQQQEDKALETSVAAFIYLYKRIIRKYKGQEATAFVEQALAKGLGQKGLPTQVQHSSPPVLIRHVLMALSKLEVKKSEFKLWRTVAVVVVALSLVFGTIWKAQGNTDLTSISAAPTFSVQLLAEEEAGVQQMSYDGALQGTVIELALSDTESEYSLWQANSKLWSITVPQAYQFLAGDGESNSLVFYDGSTLHKINNEGQTLATLSLPKADFIRGDTHYLAANFEDSTSCLIDTRRLSILNHFDDKLAFVDRDGPPIQRSNLDQYPKKNAAIKDMDYEPRFYSPIVVYDDSEIVSYWQTHSNSHNPRYRTRWSRQLSSRYGEIESVKFTTNEIIVAFTDSSHKPPVTTLTILDKRSGEVLVSGDTTAHDGNLVPEMLVSADERFMLAGVQYRDKNQVRRYLSCIELGAAPMSEVLMPSKGMISDWVLETSDQGYYIYMLDDRGVMSVFEIVDEEDIK